MHFVTTITQCYYFSQYFWLTAFESLNYAISIDIHLCYTNNKSSHLEVFCETFVLKNVVKQVREHLQQQ